MPARIATPHALEVLLADRDSDAILVLNVETALASALNSAGVVGDLVAAQREQSPPTKPVFATWIGAGPEVADLFNRADIPSYATETEAVRGFMHLVHYDQAARTLIETPPSLPRDFVPEPEAARQAVETALADGRLWLDPHGNRRRLPGLSAFQLFPPSLPLLRTRRKRRRSHGSPRARRSPSRFSHATSCTNPMSVASAST